MSEALDRTAEITKLARLLGCDPSELKYLERVPAGATRAFREQATDRIFDGEHDRLHRTAAASKLVPIPLTVQVVQRAIGPLGAAALSGLVDPDRAVKIAGKLPLDFLAEVAILMDPRRATAVIAKMPPKTVADVGTKLIGKGEYVTMGRFVGFLPRASLEASVQVVGDAELLRTAFVLEDKSRLNELAELAQSRLEGIVGAAHENDLWGEALDLVGHLDATWQGRLGDLTAGMGEDVLNAIIRAAHRTEAWDNLLPVTRAMSEDSLRAFAQAPAAYEPEVLHAIIDAAARHELWAEMFPLADALPESARPHLAEAVGELSRDQLLSAVHAAARSGNVDTLVEIALAQSEAGRSRVLEIIDGLPDLGEFTKALTAETPQVVWDALVSVRDEMPENVRAAVNARAAELGKDGVAL